MLKVIIICLTLSSIATSQTLKCKDFDVRREIDFSKMLGRWNNVKMGSFGHKHTPNSGLGCFKVDIKDYFQEEDETSLVTFFSWPTIETIIPNIARINGIKIPNMDRQGEWKLLFTYMEEHMGLYILHTDYETALVLGCAEDAFGGTDVVNYIAMMGRETKIDDEVDASYRIILGRYGIDITFDDFEHENCINY